MLSSSLSTTLSPFQIHHCFPPLPQFSPFLHNHSNVNTIYKNNVKNTFKSKLFLSYSLSYLSETDSFVNLSSPAENPIEEDSINIHTVLISHLQSCSTVKEVKRLHVLSVRLFSHHVIAVANHLIKAYVRFGELDAARKVFDTMPNRDAGSYTILLEGYRLANLINELIELFEEMVYSGIWPSSYTLVCLLKFCGEQYRLNLGTQLHACVVKRRRVNLYVNSVLVLFYAQCGELQCACNVFDRMPERDVVSWTTIITAHVQHGQGREAFRRLSAMQNDGFAPNEFTISSVLKACGHEKALRCGMQLHGAVIKGLYKNDVHMSSSLLTMYARCGEILYAQLVFDKMPKRNSITWTSMIFGYAHNGLGEKAISLFLTMRTHRVLALRETILAILYACGWIQSIHLVKEIHAHVIKNSWDKNMHFTNILIWVYCKHDEYMYAGKVLEAMPERDSVTWNAIISRYLKIGHYIEALELLTKMLWDGVEPSNHTYSSALGACAKLQSNSNGKLIHAFLEKTNEIMDNVIVGNSLLDMYMKSGHVRDAQRVFDTMVERDFVTWNLIVIGYANNGRSKEALEFMYRMQEEGFDVDELLRGIVISSFGDAQLDI